MRLSDLAFKNKREIVAEQNKNLGTRELNLNSEEVVNSLKRDNGLAREKLEKVPTEVKEELRPFFNASFWKEGTA